MLSESAGWTLIPLIDLTTQTHKFSVCWKPIPLNDLALLYMTPRLEVQVLA